jgi:hypothetical protein
VKSSRKATAVIAFLGIAVIALCVRYHFWTKRPYPWGGGKYEPSPDKQFTATADTLVDQGFFGNEKIYYQFAIRKGNGLTDPVVSKQIVQPEGRWIQWRFQGSIDWASDSEVVFTYSKFRWRLSAPK